MKKYKILFLVSLFVFSLSQLLFSAKKYKILSCSPNVLEQGVENITLNIMTKDPMPQNSLNEYLYSEIQFSNPRVHVEEVKFLNPYSINCKISADKYIEISKPIDITIISYDEDGEEVLFEGKKMLEFKRRAFITSVVAHTRDGQITRGESVNITVRGYNFQQGKIGVLLMMSGLELFYANCDNERQFRFTLTPDQTKLLPKGEYFIYMYNRDGTGAQSETKVIVK